MRSFGHLFIMRDHDDRSALCPVEVQQDLDYFVPHDAVEVARRFVRKNDLRLADDRPRYRNPLFLPPPDNWLGKCLTRLLSRTFSSASVAICFRFPAVPRR